MLGICREVIFWISIKLENTLAMKMELGEAIYRFIGFTLLVVSDYIVVCV